MIYVNKVKFAILIKKLFWITVLSSVTIITTGIIYVDGKIDGMKAKLPSYELSNDLVWELIQEAYQKDFTPGMYNGLLMVDDETKGNTSDFLELENRINIAFSALNVNAKITHHVVSDFVDASSQATVLIDAGLERPDLSKVYDFGMVITDYESGNEKRYVLIPPTDSNGLTAVGYLYLDRTSVISNSNPAIANLLLFFDHKYLGVPKH